MQLLAIIFLGLLPSVVWLTFFVKEHKKHPEPPILIILAFLLGGLATFGAFYLQLYSYNEFLLNIGKNHFLTVTVFATIEEILKWMAVWIFMILGISQGRFKDPIRPMIYSITVALGFAAVENIALLMNQSYLGYASMVVAELLILRFIGATLLHSAASGIVGFHWAGGIVKKENLTFHILVGLILASSLHATFNYLIIKYGPTIWPIAFVIFMGLIVLIDFEELKTADV